MNPLASRNGATMLPRGFLADNVLHFVRVLRAAGMPVGPAKVIDAIAAIEAVGVANKTDFREALAAVLVSRHEQIALFEQAFDVFWRNPKLLEKMVAAMLPRVYSRADTAPEAPELPSRLAQAMLPPKQTRVAPGRRGRGRAGRGVHVLAARGAAGQGLRDDDGGRTGAGESHACAPQAAAARSGRCDARTRQRAATASTCARRCAA